MDSPRFLDSSVVYFVLASTSKLRADLPSPTVVILLTTHQIEVAANLHLPLATRNIDIEVQEYILKFPADPVFFLAGP